MHFKEFFGISQIWTASDSNNRIKWVKNDIHVIESGVRPYSRNEKNPFDNFKLLSAIIKI